MIGPLTLLMTMAAMFLPGLLAFWLAARRGIAVLWAALIAGAMLGIFGWIVTREPLFGEAAFQRHVTIYFILLPAFVSLTLGAAIGALWGRR